MKSRMIIAAVAATGVLTAGGAVAASASPGSTTPSAAAAPGATSTPKGCATAPARLARLEAVDVKLQARITALKTKEAAHPSDKLQKRIDKATTREKAVSDRMHRIETRCAVPAPAAQ